MCVSFFVRCIDRFGRCAFNTKHIRCVFFYKKNNSRMVAPNTTNFIIARSQPYTESKEGTNKKKQHTNETNSNRMWNVDLQHHIPTSECKRPIYSNKFVVLLLFCVICSTEFRERKKYVRMVNCHRIWNVCLPYICEMRNIFYRQITKNVKSVANSLGHRIHAIFIMSSSKSLCEHWTWTNK